MSNYQTGDYVIINLDGNKVVGKIEEIMKEADELIFRYNEYYFPEKTSSNFFLYSWKTRTQFEARSLQDR